MSIKPKALAASDMNIEKLQVGRHYGRVKRRYDDFDPRNGDFLSLNADSRAKRINEGYRDLAVKLQESKSRQSAFCVLWRLCSKEKRSVG